MNLTNPLISIITPVYNTNLIYFKEAVESVFKQIYPNWELCICDDCSTDVDLKQYLEILKLNEKIKIVSLEQNSGIVKATNKAIELATGDVLTFLDHDDELHTDALFEVVTAFKSYNVDIVYTDEALRNMPSQRNPQGKTVDHLKPNFSPHYLLASNYICHLLAVKKELFDSVGGIREGFDGSQDHDLILRLSNASKKIFHISKVLYYWRVYPDAFSRKETLKKAIESGIKASTEELERRGLDPIITSLRNISHYDVRFNIIGKPLVSIIVSLSEKESYIDRFITNVLSETKYSNFEIIFVSRFPEEFEKYIPPNRNIRIINSELDYFNYPKYLNIGIDNANGEYIVVTHDDITFDGGDWLELLLGFAQDKMVGIVTGKLFYNDEVVDMGGIVGLDGIATPMFNGYHRDRVGDFERADLVQNTLVAPSSLMMFRKDKFYELGKFNENYTYSNFDYDLSMKFKENKLFNVIVPRSSGIHKRGNRRFNGLDEKQISEAIFKDEELFYKNYQIYFDSGDPFYNYLFEKKADYIPQRIKKETHLNDDIYANSSDRVVSFIVPVYEKTMTTIPSLLVQTYENIEIIVYYDGKIPDYFVKYVESFEDKRIKLFNTTKRYNDWGHTPRNMAIDELSSKSVAVIFTGGDNYFLPTFTEELFMPIKNSKDVLGTYCDMIHNNRNWQVMRTRLEYGNIDCGCFMARTELAREFRWGNRVDWEDWIFMDKIITKYGSERIIKIPRMLFIHN